MDQSWMDGVICGKSFGTRPDRVDPYLVVLVLQKPDPGPRPGAGGLHGAWAPDVGSFLG